MRTRPVVVGVCVASLVGCQAGDVGGTGPRPVASAPGPVAPTPASVATGLPAWDLRDAVDASLAAGPAEVRLELLVDGPGARSLTTTTRGRFAPGGDASYVVAFDLPGADQEVTVEREGRTTWFRWLDAELRLPGGARWVSAPVTLDPLLLSPRSAEVATAAAYALADPAVLLTLVGDEAVRSADDAPTATTLCCDFHDDTGPTLELPATRRVAVLRDEQLRRPLLPLVPPAIDAALRNAPDGPRAVTIDLDAAGRVRRVQVTLERPGVAVDVTLDVLRWVDDVRVSPPNPDETITADEAADGAGEA